MSRMTPSRFLGTLLVFLPMWAYQASASPLKSYALDSTKGALGAPGNLASGTGFGWGSVVASGVGMEMGKFASRSTEAVASNAAAATSPGLARSDLTPPQSSGMDANTPTSSSVTQGSVSGLGQASEPPAEAASRASPITLGTVAPGARTISARSGDHSSRVESADTGSTRTSQTAAAVGASGSTSPPRTTLDAPTGVSPAPVAAGVTPGTTTVAAQTLASAATPQNTSVNASVPPTASAGTTPSSNPSPSSSSSQSSSSSPSSSPSQSSNPSPSSSSSQSSNPSPSSGPSSSGGSTTPAGTSGSSGTASAAATASLAAITFSNPPGQVPGTSVSGPAGNTATNPGASAAAGSNSSPTAVPGASSGNGPVAAGIFGNALGSTISNLASGQTNHLPLSLVPLASNSSSAPGGTIDPSITANQASDPVSTISARSLRFHL